MSWRVFQMLRQGVFAIGGSVTDAAIEDQKPGPVRAVGVADGPDG